MNGTVLWAVFGHQHRTEQIWAAFQLGTDPPAEIRHLVGRAHDLGHRSVGSASVPGREKGNAMATPHSHSGLSRTARSKSSPFISYTETSGPFVFIIPPELATAFLREPSIVQGARDRGRSQDHLHRDFHLAPFRCGIRHQTPVPECFWNPDTVTGCSSLLRKKKPFSCPRKTTCSEATDKRGETISSGKQVG